MADADVVCTSEENATASASSPDLEGQSGNSSFHGERASSRQEVETDGLLLIRQALSKTGQSNSLLISFLTHGAFRLRNNIHAIYTSG